MPSFSQALAEQLHSCGTPDEKRQRINKQEIRRDWDFLTAIDTETRVIEELEKIRVDLVNKGDGEPQFVFETMDLDQMRLFTVLELKTVLKDS